MQRAAYEPPVSRRDDESSRGRSGLRLVAGDGGDLLPGMVGASEAIHRLARLVRRLAAVPIAVLVRGESGSGKELVARAIHALGRRSAGPFVAVNAATLHDSLAPSALFGHVRGAFTGAHDERLGAFRRADGGTLFLDEVGALPLAVQPALLRVLEEGELLAVGGDRPVRVEVRVVTATCEPLEQRIAAGAFRIDLYERIAACVVRVPPLRERMADLEALSRHALESSSFADHRLTAGALAALRRHPFPGNVRELRNVLLQAALHCEGAEIDAGDVLEVLAARGGQRLHLSVERARALLEQADGNVTGAARLAGVPRSTFRDVLRNGQKLPATPPKPGVSTGTTVGPSFEPWPDEPEVSTK